VLATLVGYLGDLDVAEDATQEAFAIAAERWPRTGAPDNPRAWLVTTARNRAIDRLRRERALATKLRLLDVVDAHRDDPDLDRTSIGDERLELIFLCCQPALALDAQVALTLRALGGLSTEAIAAALLVRPDTMKRRLSRAKARIAGVPFAIPPAAELPDRLAAVLAVLYLIFNEGYTSHPPRSELAAEAIRLARVLTEVMPDEPEALGLLALMLCHDARRAARFAGDELVLLADQDRTLWDRGQLEQGRAALDEAIAWGGRGPYVLQAAIASLQADDAVDWPQVAALYAELARATGSPVVELNRAVAVAQAGEPAQALAIADRLPLDDYPYLHSTRAELLRRLDRPDEARGAYERALALVRTEPERAFLRTRLDAI
jgi:RNA polymerase sigma-70 factor (ECF subfamily)